MKFSFYQFCIHMSVQMIDLMAESTRKKTFPFIFYFIHIFIQSFYLYIVRTCYLTSHSRYT